MSNLCHICRRPLDADEPLSLDCGGDCLACMLVLEHQLPAGTSDAELIAFAAERLAYINSDAYQAFRDWRPSDFFLPFVTEADSKDKS
jgi:hypothetical protein